MPTYTVALGYAYNEQIEVEASDEDEAETMATEQFMADNPEFKDTPAEIVVDMVQMIGE